MIILFKENNIDKEDIWKDMWVLMYSFEHISERISRTKSANLYAKPWMLRCKFDVFER